MVTIPEPEIEMLEGYGLAAPLSGIVMADELVKLAGVHVGLPVAVGVAVAVEVGVAEGVTQMVVIDNVQPPAIAPESPPASSTTYSLQRPLAFVPLKTERAEPPVGGGAGAGQLSPVP